MSTLSSLPTTTPNARHSSKTDMWYTPYDILEAARITLDGIDLDPASSYEANQRVRAKAFYTIDDDALSIPWGSMIHPASTWLNPPGGKDPVTGKSNVKSFWNRMIEFTTEGRIKHALFLSFSIEAAQVTQIDTQRSVLDYPTVFFRRRLKFVDQTGKARSGMTHSSALSYIPGTEDHTADFTLNFRSFGRIVSPHYL